MNQKRINQTPDLSGCGIPEFFLFFLRFRHFFFFFFQFPCLRYFRFLHFFSVRNNIPHRFNIFCGFFIVRTGKDSQIFHTVCDIDSTCFFQFFPASVSVGNPDTLQTTADGTLHIVTPIAYHKNLVPFFFQMHPP